MIMFILIIVYRCSAWPPARTRSTISPSARARCPIGERMMMMIYRQMDNLAPRQFSTNIAKHTIWHQAKNIQFGIKQKMHSNNDKICSSL